MVVSTRRAAEPNDRPAAPAGPTSLGGRISEYLAGNLAIIVVLVLLVLAGLPIAVWLDLRNLSERAWSGACSLTARGRRCFPTMRRSLAPFPFPPRFPSSSAD